VIIIFKRLIKSRKGGVPVLNEIVHIVLKIVPNPIFKLLFLLLIPVLLSTLMPAILSLFGYTCIDRGGTIELYQVPLGNVLLNTYVNFQQGAYNLIGVTAYHLPEDPFPYGNKKYLKIPTECFVNSKLNVSHYGYSAGCVNCISDQTSVFQTIFTTRKDMICTSDGYALNRDTGFLPDLITFCDQCSPPYPYYYNHTICLNNVEIDNGICYFTINPNVSISEVDETTFDTTNYFGRIQDLNGVLRTQNTNDMINIQCNSNNRPELYFFTIELFNQQMWLLLIIGYYLIMFAFIWYKIIRI
jgi:hypothetical protein